MEKITSLEEAVEIFSEEIRKPLKIKNVHKIGSTVSVANLFLKDSEERYGKMAYVNSNEGVMKGCAYQGKHPSVIVSDEIIEFVLIENQYSGSPKYIRTDLCYTSFLGYSDHGKKPFFSVSPAKHLKSIL